MKKQIGGTNMNKLFKRDFTMVVIGQIISLFGSYGNFHTYPL